MIAIYRKIIAIVIETNTYKKHSNTVTLDGNIPDKEILSLIDMSYALVILGLKIAYRDTLEKMWILMETPKVLRGAKWPQQRLSST